MPPVRSLVSAAVATTVFVALALGLAAIDRAVRRRFQARAWRRDLAVRGFTVVRAEQVQRAIVLVVSTLAWAAGLLAAYGWLSYVLTRFAATHDVGAVLGKTLLFELRRLAVRLVSAVPGLAAVVLIVVATRLLQRLSGGFFSAVESGSLQLGWLHPDLVQPTRRIATFVLWLVAVIAAYPYLPGSQSAAFKGVTVLVGVMLSLGSSGVIGQAMSGLVLMYSRAFKPGDFVKVGDVEGTVTSVNLMSTKIRSIRDEEVTMPSAVVVSTPTINYSRLAGEHGVVLPVTVTIGYDAPWRQVHELLESAARATAGVREEPAPFVLQRALDDYYVRYELFAFIDQPVRRAPLLSALHQNVQDAFNEAGVQIMSPHFRMNPAEPVVVPKGEWLGRAAAAPKRTG